jgi:Uma2 family endonuclease
MTAEELWCLAPTEPGELVKGRFIEMSPTGYPHGAVEARLARLLGNFVDDKKLGIVISGEAGIITQRNPDTVRGADIAYISQARLTKAKAEGYLDVPPELVVEVVSPSDRWSDINERVDEYLACGVDEVWIVDPRTRRVTCYQATAAVRTYQHDDTLGVPAILPGLLLPIADLFE